MSYHEQYAMRDGEVHQDAIDIIATLEGQIANLTKRIGYTCQCGNIQSLVIIDCNNCGQRHTVTGKDYADGKYD